MVIKQHLCGIHVAYEPSTPVFLYGCAEHFVTSRKREPCPECGQMMKAVRKSEGRSQGSHYNNQKKQIADAVAFLQGRRRKDCQPLIFVATSPGFLDRANEPRFISRLVDNLKKSYSMEHYVWVREFTGHGFPHFHFVANIPVRQKNPHTIQGTPVPFDPVKLSLTWSKYFGLEAKNSIRVGSKPNKAGKRMLYLSNNRRKAWYLAKYIGKSRSQDELRSKAKIKGFAMDQETARGIEPKLFTSKYPTETKVMATWDAIEKKMVERAFDVATGERIFEDAEGDLLTVHGIDWKRCGQHEVWIGFEKEKLC